MQSVRRSPRRATGGAASAGDAVASAEQEVDDLADEEYDGELLHSSSPTVSAASLPPKGLCAVSRSRAQCSLLRSSLASRLGSADSSAPPILPPTRPRAVEMCRQRVFENVGIQQFGLQRSERDLSCLLWAYIAILNATIHSAEPAIWRP